MQSCIPTFSRLKKSELLITLGSHQEGGGGGGGGGGLILSCGELKFVSPALTPEKGCISCGERYRHGGLVVKASAS